MPFKNPFELGTALEFGLLYAAVSVISKAAEVYAGDGGAYVSSFVAGLPDVDAVTLSMAQLTGSADGLTTTIGARAVVVGAMANALTKVGIALETGSPGLRRSSLPGVALTLVTGIGAAFLIGRVHELCLRQYDWSDSDA